VAVLAHAINACKYMFLRECGEPEDNVLRLVIEEAKAGGPPVPLVAADRETAEPSSLIRLLEGCTPVESDPSCQLFELVWPRYVAYVVRNELYTAWDDTEEFEGRHFRVYRKSPFGDYVRRATFASDQYPGPLTHWGLVCENHLVDVIGWVPPVMRWLRPIDPPRPSQP
jgi:hypothetical protein